MTTDNSLVESLRNQIEQKYQDALKALDILATYIADQSGATDLPRPKPHQGVQPLVTRTARGYSGVASGTTVNRVLSVISDSYKTVQEIAVATELTEDAVRAVLYSKSVKPKMATKKLGKLTTFKVKSSVLAAANGEKPSAAALVRALIAKHPEGLTTASITETLGDEVERLTGSKAAIGAACYNGKSRGQLTYDELDGTYRIATIGPKALFS